MTLTIPHRLAWGATARRSLLLALLTAAAACGGGSSQNLTACGNGRLDTGEQCDDGNTIDTDACTAVCTNARCGDGAIESGVEVCDGLNVGFTTCEGLGYGVGAGKRSQPDCLGDCGGYDVAPCGPVHTPTPTVTQTPIRPTATATETPTATPTPPTTQCGNGLLEPGETCESCPADCVPAACTPSGDTITYALSLPASQTPVQVTVQLAYRSSVISLPGTGDALSVKQRVRFAPPPPNANSFTVFDRDYAVDVSSARTAGLPNPFATARFDVCVGAGTAPTLEDVSCTVQRCLDGGGAPIADCRCTASLP